MDPNPERFLPEWEKRYGRIQSDLVRAHFHRELFTEFRDSFQDQNPDDPLLFLSSYANVYAHAQGVGLRRCVEALRRLVESIKSNPGALTRAACVRRAREARDDDPDEWLLVQGREHRWDSDGNLLLTTLDDDLARLTRAAAKVKHWVDKTVAHMDRAISDDPGTPFSLTFAELHKAQDELAEVANGISVLLTGSVMGMWEPALPADWKSPLRRGVFPPLVGRVGSKRTPEAE
jgi:hypothetical protein